MTHALRNRMTAILCSILLTAAQLPAALPLHAQAAGVYAQLYVSPDGDDSNAGTLSAPLKTLAGARDAVRKIKDGMTGDIVVNFRGGVYRMTEAVSFDTQDSAPDGCRIIYQAYEDETPVFSGARQVTGWEKVSDTLYAAPLDRDYKLRNLYVNATTAPTWEASPLRHRAAMASTASRPDRRTGHGSPASRPSICSTTIPSTARTCPPQT